MFINSVSLLSVLIQHNFLTGICPARKTRYGGTRCVLDITTIFLDLSYTLWPVMLQTARLYFWYDWKRFIEGDSPNYDKPNLGA